MFANLKYCKVSVGFVLLLLVASSALAQEYKGSRASVSSLPDKTMKLQLTDSQKKLSTDLVQLVDQKFLLGGTSLQTHVESMKALKQFQSDQPGVLSAEQVVKSKVFVYIKLQSTAQIGRVESLASKVTDVDTENSLVVAWVEVANLEKIASLDGVRSIRTVMPPVVWTGSLTTEGDGIHKTSNVRSTYSQSGSGMKVGIISDGVDTRSAAQATADLPADGAGLTVLSNTVGGDEGTAMLEIVHDMVPSADLYFHDCGTNTVAFNSAIDDLITAGCDIVCDDIGWITEPFFEDGTVASHVASVLSANNIIYVSSAGNAGQKHYQGDYYPIPSSTQHDFSGDGSDYYLWISMASGANVRIVLQWNDQFGSSGNDYDLGLYSLALGGYAAISSNTQDGNDNPLEWFSYTATASSALDDFAIIVDKYSGSAKTLEVYIYTGSGVSVYSNNISPVDAIFGHAAVVGAVGVGAVRVTTPTTIESFSSQGPSTITYPSPVSRAKPDIVGTDGGLITGAGSFGSWDGSNWRFYGTSASAPHVAAVCAQLWAQLPSTSGDDIRDYVLDTAVDLGTSDYDNIFGWGRADALEAFDTYTDPEIDVQRPASSSIADGGTDNLGDRVIETVDLTYTIDNSAGTAPLNVTNVTASNYVNSSGFAVSTSLPLNVAAGGTGTLDVSFDISGGGAFSLDMDITNNDANENPYDIAITGTGSYYQDTETVNATGSYTFNEGGDGHDLTLNFTSLTGSGDVTVTQHTSAPSGAPGLNVLDSYVEITMPAGITAYVVNMTFNYTDTDASGYTETDAWWGVGRTPAVAPPTNSWQWLGGTVNGGSNQIVVNGVDEFSDFAIFRQIFGDYNGDGFVDINDFQQFASVWHQTSATEFTDGSKARFFNVNKDTDGGNQIIDVNDFQGFATVWHNGQEP